MSIPHFIMWAVVLAVAAPASFRNATAGALALCYLISETLLLVGLGMPTDYYILFDMAVIAVIFAKPDRYPCNRHHHGLWCILGERSWADRFILVSYPFVWALYTAQIAPLAKWWLLWGIAVAQFLAAGAEALADHIHERQSKSDHSDPEPMIVAWATLRPRPLFASGGEADG